MAGKRAIELNIAPALDSKRIFDNCQLGKEAFNFSRR